MENPDIDRPAVHIGFPFFAALFVASFFGAPFAAVSAVLLFAAVFLLFLFKQHRQRPNFVLSLIATAAAFAVFAVAMHLFVLPTERYDGGTYTVTGNVESFLTKSNGRFYYKLHVTHIDEPVQDVDFSVRLSHSEAFPAEIGDTVTCEAKFFAFEDSLGLSPRTSWLADNMVLSAYVTDYESVQVTPAEKRPFSYYVNQIRTHFHNLILENYPKTEGSVLSALLLAVPILSPCAAPFVFLSGICVKAQNFIITLIAEHIPGTLRISGKYLPVTVVICILFFTLSVLLYRRKNKALPCVLAVCVLLCGMGANALLNQSAARLVVFRTDYAACTAIITNTSAEVLECSGNAASVETALRANGAEQINLLHVQPDEKSIRCAEKLAQLFEVKQILVPDTVYYPAENAAFYDFSYVGVLPSGSFTVTDGGETVTVTVNGTEIYLETKRSTSLSHDTDILVTEKPQSAVSAPFTILKTNGIIEDTEASLSPGAYLFMTEHESIRLDFDERGTYTVYGG